MNLIILLPSIKKEVTTDYIFYFWFSLVVTWKYLEMKIPLQSYVKSKNSIQVNIYVIQCIPWYEYNT